MTAPNSSYSELTTTTLDKYRSTLADNITTNNALLSRLKKKGNSEPAEGGATLLENLMYAQNSTVAWYSGLETLSVQSSDVMTSASFSWKELNANVVISGLEKAQNNGTDVAVFKLIEQRIKNAEITLMNSVAAALFYSNTENNGKSIGGLQHLVADLPTASSTIGGINQSTQTWWRNQYYDFSSNSVTPSETTIQHAMNTVYISALRGADKVDLFIGDTTYFSYYLESLQAQQRFASAEMASAGFSALKFWGGAADVIVDANAPASHMYGLNTSYIHFRPHTLYNFVKGENKASVNQDATVVPLFWKGNMTVSNRSLQSVICA